MNKEQQIKKIVELSTTLNSEWETMQEEFKILSTSGRFINQEGLNYNFDAKYYNLNKELQDYFLENMDNMDEIHERLSENLHNLLGYKEFEKHKDVIKYYLNVENTGFYGRSGGNYNIHLDYYPSEFDQEYFNDVEGLQEQDETELENLINALEENLTDIENIYKFVEDFKVWFFDFWNYSLKYSIECKIETIKEDLKIIAEDILEYEKGIATIERELKNKNLSKDVVSIFNKSIEDIENQIKDLTKECETKRETLNELTQVQDE